MVREGFLASNDAQSAHTSACAVRYDARHAWKIGVVS